MVKIDLKQKKFLIIGLGLIVLYLLGEKKQKKASQQKKVLENTPFGFKYGFWSSSYFDLTPKLFRKVIDNPFLTESLKMAKQNLITLNVNDNRFIIPSKDGNINNNMIYFKENGKYYKQTSSEFFKKIKNEIKIDEWKNAIEQNNLQVNKAISNLEKGINVKVPISV
jgi:hypothetical protein